MGWIVATDSGEDLNPAVPASAAENDWAVLLFWLNGSSNTASCSWSTPTSYTPDTVNSNKLYIFYKKMGSTPDTSVAITTAASNYHHTMLVCRDYDLTDIIESVTKNTGEGNVNRFQMPAITPTADNPTLLWGIASSGNFAPVFEPGVMYLDSHSIGSSLGCAAAWSGHETGAASRPYAVYGESSNHDCASVTIVLKDGGSAKVDGWVDLAAPPATMAHQLSRDGESSYYGATGTRVSDPTSAVSTIDGKTTTYAGGLAETLSRLIPGVYSARVSGANANIGQVRVQAHHFDTSCDYTNELLSIAVDTTFGELATYGNTGLVIGLGDGTNWRIWHVSARNTKPRSDDGKWTYVVQVGTAAYRLQDVGTFNPASVDRILIGQHVTGQNKYVYFGPAYTLNTMRLVGGSTGCPVNLETAYKGSLNGALNTVQM